MPLHREGGEGEGGEGPAWLGLVEQVSPGVGEGGVAFRMEVTAVREGVVGEGEGSRLPHCREGRGRGGGRGHQTGQQHAWGRGRHACVRAQWRDTEAATAQTGRGKLGVVTGRDD